MLSTSSAKSQSRGNPYWGPDIKALMDSGRIAYFQHQRHQGKVILPRLCERGICQNQAGIQERRTAKEHFPTSLAQRNPFMGRAPLTGEKSGGRKAGVHRHTVDDENKHRTNGRVKAMFVRRLPSLVFMESKSALPLGQGVWICVIKSSVDMNFVLVKPAFILVSKLFVAVCTPGYSGEFCHDKICIYACDKATWKELGLLICLECGHTTFRPHPKDMYRLRRAAGYNQEG